MRTCALLLTLLCASGAARADEKRRQDRADAAAVAVHGGKVVKGEAHQFEVVFRAGVVRVWIYDLEGRPLSTEGVTCRADIALVRRDLGWPRRGNHQGTSSTLRPVSKSPNEGRLRDLLEGKHSLGDEQDLQAIRIDLRLAHLPGNDGSAEVRVELLRPSPEVVYACPGECGRRFVDPGECPKCEGELVRERAAEGPEGRGRPGRRGRQGR